MHLRDLLQREGIQVNVSLESLSRSCGVFCHKYHHVLVRMLAAS